MVRAINSEWRSRKLLAGRSLSCERISAHDPIVEFKRMSMYIKCARRALGDKICSFASLCVSGKRAALRQYWLWTTRWHFFKRTYRYKRLLCGNLVQCTNMYILHIQCVCSPRLFVQSFLGARAWARGAVTDSVQNTLRHHKKNKMEYKQKS